MHHTMMHANIYFIWASALAMFVVARTFAQVVRNARAVGAQGPELIFTILTWLAVGFEIYFVIVFWWRVVAYWTPL